MPSPNEVRRPRRRGDEVERAVLRAAAAELEEHGYDDFTMDGVARRAGTNKTVIYRRWPGRAALVFAAYRQMVARPEELPDTGALRSDVIAVLRAAAGRLSSPLGVSVLHALLRDARRDPQLLADLRRELVEGEPEVMLTVLARAVARGQARPESLTRRVATVPIALLRNELAVAAGGPVTDATIAEIVDVVFLPLVRPV